MHDRLIHEDFVALRFHVGEFLVRARSGLEPLGALTPDELHAVRLSEQLHEILPVR